MKETIVRIYSKGALEKAPCFLIAFTSYIKNLFLYEKLHVCIFKIYLKTSNFQDAARKNTINLKKYLTCQKTLYPIFPRRRKLNTLILEEEKSNTHQYPHGLRINSKSIKWTKF